MTLRQHKTSYNVHVVNWKSQRISLYIPHSIRSPLLYRYTKLKFWACSFPKSECKESQFYSLPFGQLSGSQHVLAHKSFQLAPKPFLISRTDYNPPVIWISPKNSTCPLGKLRTKITSPMAKSTSPGLSNTTFFAHWKYKWAPPPNKHHTKNVYRCCNALSSNYSIYLESFCRHKIATIGDKMFEMLSYIYRGVFFRNHNKQRPLPPPFGQCLVDYCFPWASWVGVQHWKGERGGWGQPGRGTVGNCFELC